VELALKKSGDEEHQTGGPKHSLKQRLHAWWEGYDLGPVPELDSHPDDTGVTLLPKTFRHGRRRARNWFS
jgi:hypothetical protein